MYAHYATISLLVLLVNTLAVPQSEDTSAIKATATTKTVIVTVNRTIEETSISLRSLSSTHAEPADPLILSSATSWSLAPVRSGVPPAASRLVGSTSTTCSHAMKPRLPGQSTPASSKKSSGTPMKPLPSPNETAASAKAFHYLPINFLLTSVPPRRASANTSTIQPVTANTSKDPTVRTSNRRHRISPPQIMSDQDPYATSNAYVKQGEDCITCQPGRDVICIHDTHFGYCDEGCVEPRALGRGMKCVEGRMYGL